MSLYPLEWIDTHTHTRIVSHVENRQIHSGVFDLSPFSPHTNKNSLQLPPPYSKRMALLIKILSANF
jgi:hypothetical protein